MFQYDKRILIATVQEVFVINANIVIEKKRLKTKAKSIDLKICIYWQMGKSIETISKKKLKGFKKSNRF